jgi:hypothetical protein
MVLRAPRIVTALVLATVLAGVAEAQTNKFHLGPRISYHFDAEAVGLGAQFSAPLANHLEFYPSADYFFVDEGSLWSFNADLKYRLAAASIKRLYIGAGLNIAHFSLDDESDTETGLNLFAGVESLKGRVHPFGEFRFMTSNGSTAQLAAGLNFTLGSHK